MSVADLLSRDALKSYANLPIDADSAAGPGRRPSDGRLLIGDNVPPNSATVSVNATASNFGADKLIGKEGLTDATLKLDVDRRPGLHAKGEGRMYGAATSIEMHKPPAEARRGADRPDARRRGARQGRVQRRQGLNGAVAARITAALAQRRQDQGDGRPRLHQGRPSMGSCRASQSLPAGRPRRRLTVIAARRRRHARQHRLRGQRRAVLRGNVRARQGGRFRRREAVPGQAVARRRDAGRGSADAATSSR